MSNVLSAEAENSYRRHRLTVADYHRMGEAGVFAPDARVELIEGEVIDMAPIGSRHAGTVSFLIAGFGACLGEHGILWVQNPVVLDFHSEPQPDIAILRPRGDFYRLSHPRPTDILLLIEVSETTLRYDQEVKLRLYAREGIPEVWIVDVESSVLLVYTQPDRDIYGERQELRAPGVLAPSTLPEAIIDLSALFTA
jgi:Uma2 family endonuclease